MSTAESWGPAPAAWVPIQWLTTAQKIPFWRGDGITEWAIALQSQTGHNATQKFSYSIHY
ncbi:TPA: hypothetical protein G8V49_004534 [Salmonella enterica]|uniref:Uncharacterized protein n=1 Tax=Salmonella enterica TaxID=28901 RepID=A0A759WJ81_SALER|nr:hypothetical protein [Salmonella enterica]ELY9986825.1 hypothetical protein [Salmonella enterica]HAG2212202.1 hypothetical protein [Salmonella enterica]